MTVNKENNGKSRENENQKAGKLAGAGAGALAGAQVGTVLLPIPIVGTFGGALVGGLVGTRVGKKLGGAILDKFDTAQTAEARVDVMDELERLGKLKEAGVIDEEEFKAAKAKILGL